MPISYPKVVTDIEASIKEYGANVTDPDYCVLRFNAESGRYYCDLKTESFTVEQWN